MGSFSIWHWLVVLVVVLILFGGGGKLSRLMGDMAKGVTAFRKGLKEGDSGEKEDQKTLAGGAPSDAARPVGAPEGARRDEAAKT